MIKKFIKLKNRRGQSMVEAAFILPIIILILTGIIDFGLLLNNYLVIVNASREGARFAAVGYSDAEIGAIIDNATESLDQAKLTTAIYPSESVRKKGEEVTVTVQYENTLITPVIGSLVPNPVQIKGSTVMRIE